MGTRRIPGLARTGIAIIVCAIAASIAWEVKVVGPASVPLESGHYGEMYGPATGMRPFVHGSVAVACLVGGLLVLSAYTRRRFGSPDIWGR